MTEKRWFLGTSDSCDLLERSKDYIAKEINLYVFQTNWAGNDLFLTALRNKIYSEEEVEEAAASEMNTIFDFHVKWEYLKQLI